MNTKRELDIAEDLIQLSEALRATSELFTDLIEQKNYQPSSVENAVVFMSGIKLAADSLSNLLNEQKRIVEAHRDIMHFDQWEIENG
jgi:hypothetical protein